MWRNAAGRRTIRIRESNRWALRSTTRWERLSIFGTVWYKNNLLATVLFAWHATRAQGPKPGRSRESVRTCNLQINFLKDIFFVFDKGRDGDISCTEIKNLLAKFGFEHSLRDIDDMIREKDLDQDGRINFNEFYRIISRDTSSLGIDLLFNWPYRKNDGSKADFWLVWHKLRWKDW